MGFYAGMTCRISQTVRWGVYLMEERPSRIMEPYPGSLIAEVSYNQNHELR